MKTDIHSKKKYKRKNKGGREREGSEGLLITFISKQKPERKRLEKENGGRGSEKG